MYFLTIIHNEVFVIHHVRYIHSNTSAACVLPNHDPYDPNVMKFFWKPKKLVCKTFPDLVFANSSGFLHYNKTAISAAGFNVDVLKCKSSSIVRVNDYKIEFASPLHFTHDTPLKMNTDYVKVSCFVSSGRQVYEQLVYNIIPNLNKPLDAILPESPDQPSVVIFGIDAVSNLMAKRKLPNMVRYLADDLGAYEFQGYTKNAENSFPNIFSLLTGEIAKRDSHYSEHYIDHMSSMIWTNFSSNGYATYFAEDCPDMSIFNSVTRGFASSPVDHYLRPFFIAAHKNRHSKPFLIPQSNIDVGYISNYDHCFGNKKNHMIQIDHLKQFVQIYEGKRKFAFSWHTGLAHNEPNHLSLGDQDFVDYFKWMKHEGHLNNTILIVMGDHGSNLNDIRNTPVGRIEERMPMLYMVVPKTITNSRPNLSEILEHNTRQLISHCDTYATLVDILNGKFEYKNNFQMISTPAKISLFQRVPKDRTCTHAQIPAGYCPCYSQEAENVTSAKVVNIARKIVDKINNYLLEEKEKCEHLELGDIQDAQKMILDFELSSWEKKMSLVQYFRRSKEIDKENIVVLIRTKPGGALFEATATYSADGQIQIIDPISRSNAYGNQSYCVATRRLKPLCLCKIKHR